MTVVKLSGIALSSNSVLSILHSEGTAVVPRQGFGDCLEEQWRQRRSQRMLRPGLALWNKGRDSQEGVHFSF